MLLFTLVFILGESSALYHERHCLWKPSPSVKSSFIWPGCPSPQAFQTSSLWSTVLFHHGILHLLCAHLHPQSVSLIHSICLAPEGIDFAWLCFKSITSVHGIVSHRKTALSVIRRSYCHQNLWSISLELCILT